MPAGASTALAAFVTALCLASCGGFKAVEGPDATASGDGPPPVGGHGAGPQGSLPTGYCCSKDEECRYRSCLDFGGVRMCADHCYGDLACQGNLPGFRCSSADAGQRYCEPVAAGQACVPAQQATYGSRGLGRCCLATHDNRAGGECESGRCIAFGSSSNPYYCTNLCTKPTDCPGSYTCIAIPGGAVCMASGDPYTCGK